MTTQVELDAGGGQRVSGILYPAEKAARRGTTLLLAHGAGADQRHRFMVAFARGLASRGLDCITFNFLYTERRRRAPDPAPMLESCYRSVIESVRRGPLETNRLAIGGKSMGGRIASQILAGDVPGVEALVLLGYPLHPPGKPDQLRSKHLSSIRTPMLFLQGDRDSFGTPEELGPILSRNPLATLVPIAGADHSFTVPKTWPVAQEAVYTQIQDRIVAWLEKAGSGL